MARSSLGGISARLFHASQVVELTFESPNAAAPRDRGINGDVRLLGLYVACIRHVGNEWAMGSRLEDRAEG